MLQPSTGDADHGARPTETGDLTEAAKSLCPFWDIISTQESHQGAVTTSKGRIGNQGFAGDLRAISATKLELGFLLLRKGHISICSFWNPAVTQL